MGAPLPASWDIGKLASYTLGTAFQRSDAPATGDLSPPGDTTRRWIPLGPPASLAVDGRTLLLYLGRLLLEGG